MVHDAGELRKDADLSQRKLAEEVGLYYSTTITQIEAGKLRVQPDRYEAFAKALGVADTHAFIKQLTSYYDPATHKALFDDVQPCEEAEPTEQAFSSVTPIAPPPLKQGPLHA